MSYCKKCGLEKVVRGGANRCLPCDKITRNSKPRAPRTAKEIEGQVAYRKSGLHNVASARYYVNHREDVLAYQGQYREQNRDACNARIAAWQVAHPAAGAAKSAKYRATQLKATPSWANLDYIEGIYELCDMFRNVGLDVEVDHVVPLQGKKVSGLHVEHNLQLMHSVMNKRKSNSFTI